MKNTKVQRELIKLEEHARIRNIQLRCVGALRASIVLSALCALAAIIITRAVGGSIVLFYLAIPSLLPLIYFFGLVYWWPLPRLDPATRIIEIIQPRPGDLPYPNTPLPGSQYFISLSYSPLLTIPPHLIEFILTNRSVYHRLIIHHRLPESLVVTAEIDALGISTVSLLCQCTLHNEENRARFAEEYSRGLRLPLSMEKELSETVEYIVWGIIEDCGAKKERLDLADYIIRRYYRGDFNEELGLIGYKGVKIEVMCPPVSSPDPVTA